MPSSTGAPGRRSIPSPRVTCLATLKPAGPMPWPNRKVLELADGRVALAIPEAGSYSKIGEPVSLGAARIQAEAVLAGAPAGMPTLLFQLALAVVALQARDEQRGAAAMALEPEPA